MPHPMHDQAKKSQGDKLNKVAGVKAEYPPERAARIANVGASANKQGDSAQGNEEIWTPAAPRQISNYGKVKGD